MKNGIWNLVIVLIAAWGSDVFAYFTGMLLGKHKLIPSVSPKKTVEGAIGGICGAVIGFIIYGVCMAKFASLEVNYVAMAVSAVGIAIVSQLGDLVTSFIKLSLSFISFINSDFFSITTSSSFNVGHN